MSKKELSQRRTFCPEATFDAQVVDVAGDFGGALLQFALLEDGEKKIRDMLCRCFLLAFMVAFLICVVRSQLASAGMHYLSLSLMLDESQQKDTYVAYIATIECFHRSAPSSEDETIPQLSLSV
uniref:Transmembrane protein n=1 Tax=Ascaris lumbricoides TaxID=6252 RepID=A0A0M3I7C0_ASCLU